MTLQPESGKLFASISWFTFLSVYAGPRKCPKSLCVGGVCVCGHVNQI